MDVWTWCGCLSRPCGQDTQQRSDVLTAAALFTVTQTQINFLKKKKKKKEILVFVNFSVLLIFFSITTISHSNTELTTSGVQIWETWTPARASKRLQFNRNHLKHMLLSKCCTKLHSVLYPQWVGQLAGWSSYLLYWIHSAMRFTTTTLPVFTFSQVFQMISLLMKCLGKL